MSRPDLLYQSSRARVPWFIDQTSQVYDVGAVGYVSQVSVLGGALGMTATFRDGGGTGTIIRVVTAPAGSSVVGGAFRFANGLHVTLSTSGTGGGVSATGTPGVVVAGINNMPGDIGFGVGIAPIVPLGMSQMVGTTTLGHDNYGNYLVANSQSVMVWIPKFYYRITFDVAAPFYGTKIEISARPRDGFVIHRAFIDGGAEKTGFFCDKYQWSNALANGTDNTNTTGGIAASIKNRMPVSTATINNRISYLTGNSQTPTNTYGGVYAAAKSRGANFAPVSQFCWSALAMLSFAHAQALLDGAGAPITGATDKAAWMDVAPYAPKGCNNNALKDAQDAAVIYTTSGYSNQGLTGSPTLFSKTTHNGQACGVCDLNGNMWEVTSGLTNLNATPTALTYYTLKESIALKDLVDATTGALGAFSATPYDLVPEVWWTDAGAWYFNGNGTNQVLSGETSRTALGYLLTACRLMKDANAGSTSQVATNRFGGDGLYRKHTNLLAPVAGGNWGSGPRAGVWTLDVSISRATSTDYAGSRAVIWSNSRQSPGLKGPEAYRSRGALVMAACAAKSKAAPIAVWDWRARHA